MKKYGKFQFETCINLDKYAFKLINDWQAYIRFNGVYRSGRGKKISISLNAELTICVEMDKKADTFWVDLRSDMFSYEISIPVHINIGNNCSVESIDDILIHYGVIRLFSSSDGKKWQNENDLSIKKKSLMTDMLENTYTLEERATSYKPFVYLLHDSELEELVLNNKCYYNECITGGYTRLLQKVRYHKWSIEIRFYDEISHEYRCGLSFLTDQTTAPQMPYYLEKVDEFCMIIRNNDLDLSIIPTYLDYLYSVFSSVSIQVKGKEILFGSNRVIVSDTINNEVTELPLDSPLLVDFLK